MYVCISSLNIRGKDRDKNNFYLKNSLRMKKIQ